MRILFICTSNKDRSPALEEYFKIVYPENKYRSAGVNKYFTTKKGTHYLTAEDIEWAELIVYAEDIHYALMSRDFPNVEIGNRERIVLRLGEYKQGQVGEDYLLKAEIILKNHI